ncbi:protein DAMAGED DNA-BINDING 2 isoform X2 [Citrus clementina]|uniref:protein DAMAGED DNA-BINDING 2 isoform X2 n=1 Tax=Citrus clementina TaxID=85681 RepID=UPI000CECEEBA|nr:protein DAMAGED DNA-BINDING 2 isoform X2 [Citrus x clementina]
MAPQTRRMAFPRVVIDRDTDTEQSSSEDEEEDREEGPFSESEEEVTENGREEKIEEDLDAKRKGKAPITISLKKVCKVCKKPGHEAGFKGATYIDCPMKPCFLCKMPGHTTMSCPHRVATEYGVTPASHRNAGNPVEYVFERQLRPNMPHMKPAHVIPDQVNCAVIRYHSRRVTCLEFHPTNNHILLSGDKGPRTWRMLYGMDINPEKGVVLVADNFGFLYLVDTRTNSRSGEAILIHRKGSKVVGLHCNPIQPELLLSCGNDHFARIWDIRRLEAGSSLCDLPHKRVVNSAYFSPSGSKILTTSQDNRLRIWDSIFGNLDSPSREIVHSHDFNRHLTPFRAEWDPKDPSESLAVIGRYISENYNGAALHPIDFIDITTGQLVAEVMDPNITTISPVNKLHPRDDVLASGSSRSIFIWRPKEKSELVEQKEEMKIIVCGKADKKQKHKFGDESEDSDDDTSKLKRKNVRSKKSRKS